MSHDIYEPPQPPIYSDRGGPAFSERRFAAIGLILVVFVIAFAIAGLFIFKFRPWWKLQQAQMVTQKAEAAPSRFQFAELERLWAEGYTDAARDYVKEAKITNDPQAQRLMDQMLSLVVTKNDIEFTTFLLDEGANPNQSHPALATQTAVPPSGLGQTQTPLMTAAALRFTEMLELLIERGADVNATVNGKSVFHFVRDVEDAELLQKAGANNFGQDVADNTPLDVAIGTSNVELVQWLAERTPGIPSIIVGDDDQAVMEVISSRSNWAMRDLGKHLNLAIALDRRALVKSLLEFGASVDGRVRPNPLSVALFYNRQEIVLMLIPVAHLDTVGHDAMFTAIDQLNHEVVAALLAAGYREQLANASYSSVVAAAAGSGNLKMLQTIFAARGNLTAEELRTPLLRAIESGNPNVVSFLLDAGADPNLTADFVTNIELPIGSTEVPLQRALSKGNAQIVQLLLNAGAQDKEMRQSFSDYAIAKIRGQNELIELLWPHFEPKVQ